jgi:hypothetical protein
MIAVGMHRREKLLPMPRNSNCFILEEGSNLITPINNFLSYQYRPLHVDPHG